MARKPGQRRLTVLIAALVAVSAMLAVLAPSASAASIVPISGSGSTWSSNALDQWRRAVASQEGITVNYAPNGSTSGRNDFSTGQVDFAVSEIPYGSSRPAWRHCPMRSSPKPPPPRRPSRRSRASP